MSTELFADTLLSHYRIVSKLGAGGMGEVYLAEDLLLDRKVALKILPEALAANPERMKRFVREAKSASALNHPNILTIYEIGQTDDLHFIAAEYVEGDTLRQRLQQGDTELKFALDVAIQVASALDTAHRAGIIHRDVKPENVMIRPDGLVKLCDFGIAKLTENKIEQVEAEADTAMKAETKAGAIIGTAPYMSPEQARGRKIDARTDIFSFGAMLYEMLAGRTAFEGENAIDTISSILHKEPESLDRWAPAVPRELQRIVEKSLRKERDERYQTARDLLIDLRDLKQDLEFRNKLGRTLQPDKSEAKTQIFDASATGQARRFSSAEITTSSIKKRKLGFAVGLIILLFATVGGGVWFFSNRPTRQIEAPVADAPKQAPKLYWQMTEAEQLVFIQERARHIQTLIGDEPLEFDEGALRAIKVEIDDYVEEKDSLSQKPFEEGLRVIYGRASQYAPLIIQAYEARKVPAALGLYQAMIESEYHDCMTSPNVGLFQFTRRTAATYGLMPKDYCNVEKQADAAARYMSDLISDFGEGKSSWTLALFSFNQGGDRVREYLRQLRGRGITERNFWAVFRHRQDLQPSLTGDGKEYVPRFFAAAMIGETPEVFDLATQPLSSLRKEVK